MKKILQITIIILILIPLFLGSILLFDNGNIKYQQEIEINEHISKVNNVVSNIYNMNCSDVEV